MRLATFSDGANPRFGIVRGDRLIDVVAAADALRIAPPALTVKAALTTGRHTLAALAELVAAAERAGLGRPLAGVRLLPPIPDPSKFFCVGKNTKKHRDELVANKMLTEMPNEPTGFIKLVSTMSGDGDEVVTSEGCASSRASSSSTPGRTVSSSATISSTSARSTPPGPRASRVMPSA